MLVLADLLDQGQATSIGASENGDRGLAPIASVVAITRSVSFSFLRIFAISGTLSPIDWRALAFQQWLLNGSHRKVARSGGQSDGTRRVHGSQLAGEQAAQPGSELFDINQRAKIVYDVNPELPAASTFTFKI